MATLDVSTAKQQLLELIKREDLGNKLCADCGNPNPQWASVSFAIFICLSCAGVHRGFGVHISFVRSCTMDTWTQDQLKRMKLGGNNACRDFLVSYKPTEQGGYTPGMSIHDKYHCWAASQYREKLTAELEDREWSPSAPPPPADSGDSLDVPARPSSAQGLRKSRTGAGRSGTSPLSRQSASPSPARASTLAPASPSSQKASNEAFFESLGQSNALRPDDIPPSQGGRYAGFGNTPTPPASSHPSFGLSSANAPTIADFQTDPVAALGKGWSLFSSVVANASKVVNDNVIQPGLEKAMDPNLRQTVGGYVSGAGRIAGDVGSSANEWGKSQLGVDMGRSMGNIVGSVKQSVGGGSANRGYSSLSGYTGDYHDDQTSALYAEAGDDDFFNIQRREVPGAGGSGSVSQAKAPAKDDNDDEWQDW